jgi:sugar phosphate isomerase/epimerase
MILKRQKIGAFQLAKTIGADGVEVDMGGLGNRPTFDSKLGDPVVRKQFLDQTQELGLGICSIAMSGFYAQSFAERPGVDRMVQDCLDTAKAMKVKVVFLPLGVTGDLIKHPELRPAIVARLKAAGKRAEAAGVVIGVETSLDAKAEAALLDEIGSPAVKSYFNFSNAWQNHRDVCAELKILGKERIVQIHASNKDGVWLQNDSQVDLPKIKATLDEMGWSGWLVIERSRDATRARDVKFNYGANAAYLKKVFQQ